MLPTFSLAFLKAWILAGVYLFELVETESLGDECPEILRAEGLNLVQDPGPLLYQE